MQQFINEIESVMNNPDCTRIEKTVLKRVKDRATELLQTEREQIEEAVMETTKRDVLLANNLLNMMDKDSVFEVSGNEGEQYYKDTYE